MLKIGGKQVTEHLMNQLMNGKYSFPDDNFLLWRKKKKTKFTVSSRKEIIREMKVMHCREREKLWCYHLTNKLMEIVIRLKMTKPVIQNSSGCNVEPKQFSFRENILGPL